MNQAINTSNEFNRIGIKPIISFLLNPLTKETELNNEIFSSNFIDYYNLYKYPWKDNYILEETDRFDVFSNASLYKEGGLIGFKVSYVLIFFTLLRMIHIV